MRLAQIGLVFLYCFAAICPSLRGQATERRIWDDYFGSSRPAATATGKGARPVPQYRPSVGGANTGERSKTPEAGRVALGVTIWKLGAPGPNDRARLLVQEEGGAIVSLSPHCIAAGEPLQPEDRVRLSIEASTSGYVYVIDQEMHWDGTLGAPYLIFPTEKTRRGDNSIRAGQLIDVPAQTDAPNVFFLRPGTAGESGEKLTIILEPQPIAGVKISDSAQEISRASFDAWTSRWVSLGQQFELTGGDGRPWTPAEQEAGQSRARLLTQEDPAPQTVFTFPPLTSQPAMASIVLQLKKK
jgi:hypothetical protein